MSIIDSFEYTLSPQEKSIWTSYASLADLACHEFPSAKQTVLLADDAVPTDKCRLLEELLLQRGEWKRSLKYAVNQKDESFLHQIADDLQSERCDLVYILGGGTLSDVAGLAVSIINRRIATVLLPTTTIAMCDASVGGLTGIDRHGMKNAWSTRQTPLQTIACFEFLSTLPDDHFRAGFAEVIKMAWLDTNRTATLPRILGLAPQILERQPLAVLEAMAFGAQVRSEWLAGEKLGYNLFGHNIGHAIEIAHGVSHGEAVSHGILIETAIARGLKLISESMAVQIANSLMAYSLPGLPSHDFSRDKVASAMVGQRLFNGSTFTFWLPSEGLTAAPCCPVNLTPEQVRPYLNRYFSSTD